MLKLSRIHHYPLLTAENSSQRSLRDETCHGLEVPPTELEVAGKSGHEVQILAREVILIIPTQSGAGDGLPYRRILSCELKKGFYAPMAVSFPLCDCPNLVRLPTGKSAIRQTEKSALHAKGAA